MKKIFPIFVGIAVIVGGFYYVMNPIKPISVYKCPPHTVVDKSSGACKKVADKAKNIAFKPCEKVKELELQLKGQCTFKNLTAHGSEAAVVQVGETNGIVLADGSFHQIQTSAYYNPKPVVESYLNNQSIALKGSDWQSVTQTLQQSKRGYLLGLSFKTPKKGTIYISPNGRVTGKLN